MQKNFLLNSSVSKKLYKYVASLPIVDYHNHLSVSDIATNKRFLDVYDLWIKPDPYKHRAMRMCGVEEEYITGDMPPKEKFIKWCEVFPSLIGNPLYHWSMMELSSIFGIDEMPCENNSEKLYQYCNDYLKNNIVTVQALLDRFNVEYACPCASLIDDISVFENNSRLSPSLRGDDITRPTAAFIEKLESHVNFKITTLKDFEKAITQRLKYFSDCGCVFADHALDNGFEFFADDSKNEERFSKLLNNEISCSDNTKLSSYILAFLGAEYSKLNFVMQLHIGAERYTSSKLREKVGPQGGFAAIGNSVNVSALTNFLDYLDQSKYGLPKTVLFTLNPADNALISVLSGSYSKDGVKGLITQGPAWWWCDHKLGIVDMLENTSSFSLLSNFVGMTTDSRSFLSFVRHDYFRRIICSWLGEKIENGEYFCSDKVMEELLLKLCYKNAKELF